MIKNGLIWKILIDKRIELRETERRIYIDVVFPSKLGGKFIYSRMEL